MLVFMKRVGGLCVAVFLLSLCVGAWLSWMGYLGMCACLHHHARMHGAGRSMCPFCVLISECVYAYIILACLYV
jgi:hypothetical protein